MENQITVSVTGASRVEIAKRLRAFADNLDGTPADSEGKVMTTTTTAKKAQPKTKTVEASFDDDAGADETESFDDKEPTDEIESTDDDEDFTTPAKKTAKAKKVTVAQVNDACKARAKSGGKKGRDEVLAILKKQFKTESISEIKPERYADVIAAMEIE